jgi:hypothetical protein
VAPVQFQLSLELILTILGVILIPIFLYFWRLEVRIRDLQRLQDFVKLELRIRELEKLLESPIIAGFAELSAVDAVNLYEGLTGQKKNE